MSGLCSRSTWYLLRVSSSIEVITWTTVNTEIKEQNFLSSRIKKTRYIKQHGKHKTKLKHGRSSIISDEPHWDGKIQCDNRNDVPVSTLTSQEQNRFEHEDSNDTFHTSILLEQNQHKIHDLSLLLENILAYNNHGNC